ncbi:MAG TPA: type II toxin-antitoxin system VapC family toxin [Candidatus Sulfotelmatobacter sp.]|jgi:PIN domain nuclease of toxin-antitoxin system
MILLDTHVVIWLAQEYQRISSAARSKIEDARRQDRGLAVSDITFLEIARLGSCGQINLIPDAETVLAEVERRFVVLPITANIALQAYELPSRYPKDPADRIIGATALVEDIPLVTADREIRKSRAIPTIW